MERQLVLASHGKFASGIYSSLELICGANEKITTLDCYVTEDFDLGKAVDEVMADTEGKEVVVVTDLFGGSVNNEFLRHIERPDFYLVAGLNLPFLVEFVTQFDLAENLGELIETTLDRSKETIQFCNQSFQKDIEEEEF